MTTSLVIVSLLDDVLRSRDSLTAAQECMSAYE